MMKTMMMTLLLWVAGMPLISGDLSAKQTPPADQTTREVPDVYYAWANQPFQINASAFTGGLVSAGYHLNVYLENKNVINIPNIRLIDNMLYFTPAQGSHTGRYIFIVTDDTGKQMKIHTIWLTVYEPI